MVRIVKTIMKAATPEIIENLRLMVQEIVDRAKATPNPWDDIFAGIVQSVIGKPGDKIE